MASRFVKEINEVSMNPETVTIVTAIISAVAAIAVAIIQLKGQRDEKTKAREKERKALARFDISSKDTDSNLESARTIKHLERITSSKILRAGTVKHPPLSDFEMTKGQVIFSGYYVELCKSVCETNDITPQFVAVDWADIPYKVFNQMDLDLVLSVFETVQRLDGGDFTSCFHKVRLTGLTNSQNTKVSDVNDLYKDDVRIVVTRGEAGWEYVTRELKVPRHRLIIVENSNITEMMDYVLTGRVDVAICDEVSCQEYAKNNRKVKHLFKNNEIFICKNCIMVPKDDKEFRDWVNLEFRKSRNVPQLLELEEKILSDPEKLIRKYS